VRVYDVISCTCLCLCLCRVFVNGRSRPTIIENMRARIDRGDIKSEEKEAIKVSTCMHDKLSRPDVSRPCVILLLIARQN